MHGMALEDKNKACKNFTVLHEHPTSLSVRSKDKCQATATSNIEGLHFYKISFAVYTVNTFSLETASLLTIFSVFVQPSLA